MYLLEDREHLAGTVNIVGHRRKGEDLLRWSKVGKRADKMNHKDSHNGIDWY
jgi:hypothetical protein